ncbi:MAG: tRNA uridine-5-carboxymethylaminomethyl(34) synthesis GTPase MnmE [Halioglobus sp.]
MEQETIVAIATASGTGGIGIVRLSGPNALNIGSTITRQNLKPRHAHYCAFRDKDDNPLDSGICLYFPAPNSFTGEDIVELQAHGGPLILDIIQREACNLGARQAQPGEFSQRAFLNGKIDLTQAEAIADLINSATEQAALNATRSLQGVFSRKIDVLMDQVTQLRVYVEAAIDFPEEEIDFINNGEVSEKLGAIVKEVDDILREAHQGALIQEGMKVVIAGKPNAGKSSLLNALSGQETAIVTPYEGTTRDVLKTQIQIEGMPLHIVDTAGLRDSEDIIEQEGIRRAQLEIETADRILLVVDASTHTTIGFGDESEWLTQYLQPARKIPVTIVANKCDLTNQPPDVRELDDFSVVHLSAKTGSGLDVLRDHLKMSMGYRGSGEGRFSARRRHLLSLEKAKEFLLSAQQQLKGASAGELIAEDLRLCQQSLGEITGAISSDELLGEIFSSFCIGK